MQIRNFLTPEHFLHTCGPILERHEPLNNLMLGLAADLIHRPAPNPAEVLMYAFAPEEIHGDPVHGHAHAHAGEPYFFAFQSDAKRGLVVYATEQLPPERIPVIAACLRNMHPGINGISGPRALTRQIAELWTPHATLDFDQILHQTQRIVPPARMPAGHRRKAVEADLVFLPDWMIAFAKESMTVDMTRAQAEKQARNRFDDGAIEIWEEGGNPVSMLFIVRPTKTGCMVGYVYTPPAQRGNGYASALVAEATQAQLDRGRAFVALFTDEANPTSNKIYRAIGYEPIAEFTRYKLHPGKN
jgi:predicted GNAT family acetyltransferase